MLFTLTSLPTSSQLRKTVLSVCAVCLFSGVCTIESRNGGLGDAGEAGTSGRPAAGEFEPQIPQAGTFQQSTLNTVTPPRVTECAYTCNSMCSPPRLHACSSHTSSGEGVHGPPAAILEVRTHWSSEVQKVHDSVFKCGPSVHVATVREYPTSAVLYSWRSQLGRKRVSENEGQRETSLSQLCSSGDLFLAKPE